MKPIDRLKEPSSYAGIAAIMGGFSMLFPKAEALHQATDVVVQAGQAAAQGQGVMLPLFTIVAGLAAIFLPEKKR